MGRRFYAQRIRAQQSFAARQPRIAFSNLSAAIAETAKWRQHVAIRIGPEVAGNFVAGENALEPGQPHALPSAGATGPGQLAAAESVGVAGRADEQPAISGAHPEARTGSGVAPGCAAPE